MEQTEGLEGANLIRILTALNEIGASINRLGLSDDLETTLQLIVDNAVRVVAASVEAGGTDSPASAVIWIYDQGTEQFDPGSRVSAGEPTGASTDDFPRPDGLGQRAVNRRQRILSYAEPGQSIHPRSLR